MSLRTVFLAAALAGLAALAQAQAPGRAVAAPPLPIGSLQARPEPGMNEAERKRAVRAHHHKFQHGKDYTRDDSVQGHESLAAGAQPAGKQGAGAATAPGAGSTGAGTARPKTDRGASSWFFGNDKK